MPSDRAARRITGGVSVAIVLTLVAWVAADHGTGMGHSFLVLAPGFTQEIFGVSPDVLLSNGDLLGGVAFAPDGDPWVLECESSAGSLHRFDGQTPDPPVHATPLHHQTVVPGDTRGCGLVNGADGALYANTRNGVRKFDQNTGADLDLINALPGNTLGIAVDPQTSNLYYIGLDCDQGMSGDCPIHEITTTGVFVRTITVPAIDASWVDGLYFDPDGNFIFLANRQNDANLDFRLTVLDRAGNLVQHVRMTCEPDGVAFHAAPPRFVVTNNTANCTTPPMFEGSITRFDFLNDDYTQPPIQLQPVERNFATGGFRGDLMQVGADGCLYLTQAGTRYNDFTEDLDLQNSLVRICEPGGAGFDAPPGVETPASPDIKVVKTAFASPINAGATASFTVTVSNIGQGAANDVVVTDNLPSGTWTVSAPMDAGCPTPATGTLTCTFTGTLNPFAVGATVNIMLSRTTTTADCGTLRNTASASASNESQAARSNNSAEASIIVQCPPPPPPPPPSECKMTGGGEFLNNANQLDSFGLIAQTKQNGEASGHFNLVNHVTGLHVNGPVSQITCGPAGSHTLKFTGTDTKRPCTFTVEVQDNGEPGIEDRLLEVTFSCGSQVTPPDGETLLNGNLQFHPTHD